MYKAIIIDDERHARNEVQQALKGQASFELFECSSYENAINDINTLKPDLIFLDIQLNGRKTGFDVLENCDHLPQVIFITAYDEYAIKAFEKNAIDYLLKPIDGGRFNEALKKALAILEAKKSNLLGKLSLEEKVFLKEGDECWFVKLSDIIYFESNGNYTKVFFEKQSPLILKSLSLLEERLDEKHFFRTSRTQIVNVNKIDKINAYSSNMFKLTLINGQDIVLSRRQSVKFKDIMSF
jgi:two-component system, LytTR family, response regulator